MSNYKKECPMRALVSGGSSGIGASACLRIAEAALARGSQPKIAVCGHQLTTTQEKVVQSIEAMGGIAIALSGDLGDPKVPSQLVAAAVAEFGGLDALVANAGIGAYSPTKAALTMLAQTLALEWAPDGIRVNVVSPGMTHTPMSEKMYADPQIKKARQAIIPLARIGEPVDIANVIEFLVSPLSAYVTGQDICVDGGFSKSILSHIPGRPSSKS